MDDKIEKKEDANKWAWMKGVVGRKAKFASVDELEKLMKKYFMNTPYDELTVSGMALACGTSRKYIDEYQKKDEFKSLITQAKAIVENSYEQSLRKAGRTGDIFALKQFGWKDEFINTNTHSGEIKTGINWIGNANILQEKAVNSIAESETKSLPKGEDDE